MNFETYKAQVSSLGYSSSKVSQITNLTGEDQKLLNGALDYVKESDRILFAQLDLYSILILTDHQVILGKIVKPTKGFLTGLLVPSSLNQYKYESVLYSNITSVKIKKNPDLMYGQTYDFELPMRNGEKLRFRGAIYSGQSKSDYQEQAQLLSSILNQKIM